MTLKEETFFQRQVVPVALTVLVCAVLIAVLWLQIAILNYFTNEDILLSVRWYDIVIGLTIYLKTSIDFAIYIGRMMESNQGWKNRVVIEIGTALGNAAGTMAVLVIWTFFKEVRWLLALMISLAALVLFKLAEDGLAHAKTNDSRYPWWFRSIVGRFEFVLERFNALVAPVLNRVVPHMDVSMRSGLGLLSLFQFSFTIPFVLGLDDFAGYVPLFSIVNVFGFAIGVFVGHMILNMLLYISPTKTITVVKNPIISLLGSVAFVGLGIWGLVEVIKLIGH